MQFSAMTAEQVEDYVARNGLDDDMFFNLHADCLKMRELLIQASASLNNRRDYDTAALIDKALEL